MVFCSVTVSKRFNRFLQGLVSRTSRSNWADLTDSVCRSRRSLCWQLRQHTLGLTILALSLTVGCASLRRNPVPASVVAARQLSLKGIEAMDRGRWQQAEALFAAAIETYPADERAHQRYAELLWQRGDRGNAIQHMERCTHLSGGDPNLLVRLGEMHLSEGRTSWAARRAAEAIQANRESPAAWALRGDVLAREGELAAAMASYHRALSLQPQYPHVQLALAEIYQHQKRPQRVLSTLDSLVQQLPPEEIPRPVFYLQGLALKDMNRYGDAINTLSTAIRKYGPDAELLFRLSECQLLAGDVANARLAVRAALAHAPSHLPSQQLQARIGREGFELR